MYIDATREDFLVTDPTFTLSLNGVLPDTQNEVISVALASLRSILSALPNLAFFIEPNQFDAGKCFCIRDAQGNLSFTHNFESIIRTLSLTVSGVVNVCRRKVRQVVSYTVERAKNVVRSTAPRFLRL